MKLFGTKRRVTAATVVASLAVAGMVTATQAHANTTRPVLTAKSVANTPAAVRIFDGAVVRLPSSIQPASEARVYGIHWSSWTSTSATGTGTLLTSYGLPGDSVSGGVNSLLTNSRIRLSTPATLGGQRVFTKVQIQTTRQGATSTYTAVRDSANRGLLTYRGDGSTLSPGIQERVPFISRTLTGLSHDVVRPQSFVYTTHRVTHNDVVHLSNIAWTSWSTTEATGFGTGWNYDEIGAKNTYYTKVTLSKPVHVGNRWVFTYATTNAG